MKILCYAALAFLSVMGLIGCWAYYALPFLFEKSPPFHTNKPIYMNIIRAIQLGQLSSKSSTIVLPPAYKGAAFNGVVYHERRKDGRLWVIIPTSWSRVGDVHGLLYSSGPLVDQDFHTQTWGSGPPIKYLRACGYDLPYVNRVDTNWYAVSRNEG